MKNSAFVIIRATLRLFAVLVVVNQLSACSLFSSDDDIEPAELVKFDELVELDSLWSRRVGDQGEEEMYLRLTPVIAGDVIYAANRDGKVFAIDRHENDRLWKVDVEAELTSALGAGNGLVLVGTAEGILIALGQEDGSEKWRSPLSSEMLAAAQADGDVVVVQTMDGKASGLSAATGKKLWTYATTAPALTLRTSASPFLEGGIAYLAFANGRLVALDQRNGLLLWEQQVSFPQGRNELERLISYDGKPLISGNDIYLASYQGHAVSLEKVRGRMQWQEKISAFGQLAAADGNLYLTQSDDTVVALKMANGRKLWENNKMAHRRLTGPVVLGEYVVVADAEGYLHVMRQSDGEFAGRKRLWSDSVRNPLLSDGEKLYVLTNDGNLRAFQLALP